MGALAVLDGAYITNKQNTSPRESGKILSPKSMKCDPGMANVEPIHLQGPGIFELVWSNVPDVSDPESTRMNIKEDIVMFFFDNFGKLPTEIWDLILRMLRKARMILRGCVEDMLSSPIDERY